jgi:hypothetical protein
MPGPWTDTTVVAVMLLGGVRPLLASHDSVYVVFTVGETDAVEVAVESPEPTPVMEQEFATAVPGTQLQVRVEVAGGTICAGEEDIVQSGVTTIGALSLPGPEVQVT